MKLILTTSLIFSVFVSELQACIPPAFTQVAEEYSIPKEEFFAIALTESGITTEEYGYGVWPWALNIDEKSYFPRTKEEALSKINEALSQGTERIAVGTMQVFWQFHKAKFNYNPSYVLDPATNLRLGATVFDSALNRASSVHEAIGFYYAGYSAKNQSKANDYAKKVYKNLNGYLARCRHDQALAAN